MYVNKQYVTQVLNNFPATIKWKINVTVWALSIREGHTDVPQGLHWRSPNGLVSGPIDLQIGMRTGRNCHYIIMPFSDEIRSVKTFAIFQACYCIPSYLCECRCTVTTDILILSLRLTNGLELSYPITLLQYHWGGTIDSVLPGTDLKLFTEV